MTNPKPKEEERRAEAKLVRALRENDALKTHPIFAGEKMTDGRWSYRLMERYFNEQIPQGMPGFTTFASIWDWEIAKHPVTSECLQAWMMHYAQGDPRHELAKTIFALRMRKNQGKAHLVGRGVEDGGKRLLNAVRVGGKKGTQDDKPVLCDAGEKG